MELCQRSNGAQAGHKSTYDGDPRCLVGSKSFGTQRAICRCIIGWKLCSTMRAEDVTDTLDLALAASGCDHAHVRQKPPLLVVGSPAVKA